MSTFSTISKKNSQLLNYEGAEAFKLSAEMELYTAVVTDSISDKFYETSKDRIDRIVSLIGECDHLFVAQLAVYARKQMNLRSVPLFLIVELAKIHNGDDLISRTIEQVVHRADEIMELLICYQWRNEKEGTKKLAKLSHQVQIGLQHAFNSFDEYQFAKYDRDNLTVKLRDALFLVHPKAKDEAQQRLFDNIANNSLKTPYTWETEFSALGKQSFDSQEDKDNAFKDKWEELICSGKLGYMALLRNLRNILQNKVCKDYINDVAKRISNPKEVLNSKLFPFRYLSAYREISEMKGKASLQEALEQATIVTAQTIAGFDENTRVLLACDVSGSMYSRISRKSSVKNFDVGLMLAMLLKNRCQNVVTGIFGDEWKVVNLPSENILSNVNDMYKCEGEVGYCTNGYKVIKYLNVKKIVMDKVMMFTDCQMWNSDRGQTTLKKEWRKYKKIAPNAKLYLFDLAGYGSSPLYMPQNDVFCIAGWSNRIFDMLEAIENGDDAISVIKKIEI